MASEKPSPKNPNRVPLGSNRAKTKKKEEESVGGNEREATSVVVSAADLSASQQLRFFLDRFQSANFISGARIHQKYLHCGAISGSGSDSRVLSESMKNAFGKSWKEVLCEGQLLEGEIDPGSPAVLAIGTSALRSLELHRLDCIDLHQGLTAINNRMPAAKLFAKHMKVEDQVSLLKNRVNIASGTPNRIKKLIEMDALGLSRLAVLVLDMHTDAKGYSLFSLPQVSGEFWDLYNNHFHHRLVKGDLRICLYGPIPCSKEIKDVAVHDALE